MPRDFKKLNAFKHADDFVLDIYKVTAHFPKSEMFGLTSQLRRAAVSVPANIVEGSYRSTLKEYIHFLYISLSSLAEAGYYIDLAHQLEYLDDKEHQRLAEKHLVCIKMLNATIGSLKEKM